MRSVQRSMCAGMLGLQAVVLFLLGVTLPSLTDLGAGAGIAIGLGLGLLCVVAAGMMRSRPGFVLGWVVQVVTIAAGLLTPVMFALGAVFLALYGGSYVLGARIDRERAERVAASVAADPAAETS